MNTQFVIPGIRINLAPRANRRCFVALTYAGLASWIIGWSSSSRVFALVSVVVAGASLLAFISVAGSGYEDGDEREVHRRDHAFFVVHRQLNWVLILVLFMAGFRDPNSIAALAGPALAAILERFSYAVLFALVTLYGTLPQAVLLWTEPDMEEPQ